MAEDYKSFSVDDDAWQIIKLIKYKGIVDKSNAISWAVKKLAMSKDEKIFRFDDSIRKFLHNIDGKAWASQVYDDLANVDEEEFLAIRCGAVTWGERNYNRVLDLKEPLEKNFKFKPLQNFFKWPSKIVT